MEHQSASRFSQWRTEVYALTWASDMGGKKENGGKMSAKTYGEVGRMVLRQYFLLGGAHKGHAQGK